MVTRAYSPSQLDDATVARAARLLEQGMQKTDVMFFLTIGEGSIYRIERGTHPALVRAQQHKRCTGCGGKLHKPQEPCRVCRDRTAINLAAGG